MGSVSEITYREIRERSIPFINKSDLDLFDEITEFRKSNVNIEDAFKKYVLSIDKMHPNADAIIKIVYSAPFHELIIKYSNKKDSDRTIELRNKMIAEILTAGLFVEVEPAVEKQEFYIKIIAPFLLLCKNAEKEKLRFPMKDFQHASETSNNAENEILDVLWGNNHVRAANLAFKTADLSKFKGGDSLETPFNNIVRSFFSSSKRILITNNILNSIKIKGNKANKKTLSFKALREKDVYIEYFPLHEGSLTVTGVNSLQSFSRYNLYRNWALTWWKAQPLDDIRDYLGGIIMELFLIQEKVALYFAWLGYYSII
jgi:hypothetical protein